MLDLKFVKWLSNINYIIQVLDLTFVGVVKNLDTI